MQQSQSVFITGGSEGLGLESAKQLAQTGWRIGIFARDPVKLRLAREELIFDNPEVDISIFSGDVRNYEELSKAIDAFASANQFQNIQAVIHAAGRLHAIGPLHLTDIAEAQSDMATSLGGAMNLFHGSAKWLEKSPIGGAAIAFVGPGFHEGLGFGSAYAAAQAGLVRLIENLAQERKWPERAGGSPEGEIGYYALYSAVTSTGVMNYILGSDEGRKWLHRFTEMFAEGKEVEPHVPAATAAWLAARRPKEISGRVVSGMLDPDLTELRLAILSTGDKGRLRVVY